MFDILLETFLKNLNVMHCLGNWGNANGFQQTYGQGGVSMVNNSSILSTGMQQGTPSQVPFGNFPAANSVGTLDNQYQMYGQNQVSGQNQFAQSAQFAPQFTQQQFAQQQQQQLLAQQQMFAAQVCFKFSDHCLYNYSRLSYHITS